MFDAAIYIGRFEPVHNGHLALLRQALASAAQVVVVLGSAWQARSPKNPFTWQERRAMLEQALQGAERARVQLLPVRDYYNQAVWVDAVRKGVARCLPDLPAAARVALIGHFKDASSSYLGAFCGWELLPLARQGPIDASAIRDAYFGATPAAAAPDGIAAADDAASAAPPALAAALAPLADHIPPATHAALLRFACTPQYRALQRDWRLLRACRAAWAAAPCAPVFASSQAVLRWRDQVLLGRRSKPPGAGLLTLPGARVGPRETLWQACLRALAGPAGSALPEARLRAALQTVTVFDHPDRSQRGRTLAHAHYFDLEHRSLPAVPAGAGALPLQWTAISALPALEEEFFEDHFHMLDHFLGIS